MGVSFVSIENARENLQIEGGRRKRALSRFGKRQEEDLGE